jgi:hypothetical protein
MFLAEARQDFKDSCSVQVYSSRPVFPKTQLYFGIMSLCRQRSFSTSLSMKRNV